MKIRKSISNGKIVAVSNILYSAIFYLIQLLPFLYSKTENHIEPITGYSLFTFMEDRADTLLYSFSLLYAFEFVFVSLVVFFSFCRLFMPEDRDKINRRISYFCLSLAILCAAVDLGLSFFLSGSNLYPNLGVYLNLIWLVYVLATSLFLFHLLKKRRKNASEQN